MWFWSHCIGKKLEGRLSSQWVKFCELRKAAKAVYNFLLSIWKWSLQCFNLCLENQDSLPPQRERKQESSWAAKWLSISSPNKADLTSSEILQKDGLKVAVGIPYQQKKKAFCFSYALSLEKRICDLRVKGAIGTEQTPWQWPWWRTGVASMQSSWMLQQGHWRGQGSCTELLPA